MNLKKIEQRVLFHSEYVKNIEVVMRDGYPYAIIHPNFEMLKEKNIINIEEEIRWYGVELYNMEAKDDAHKIHGYEIVSQRQVASDEPDDEIYRVLKEYVQTAAIGEDIYPSSHLELDLDFDSLDYVELFIFMENSFGIVIDEATFSKMMTMQELYEYIKEHQNLINPTCVNWDEVLKEKIDEKLIYSPFIMFMYKTILFPFFKIYLRMDLKGVDNIPSTPCIIAPTHQSMLDGFLIEATLPYKILKRSFFLAYKQVFGTDLLKPIATYGQSILIDANEDLKHTMQYCALPLKEENNLVIFPEGARTRDRKLLEFRPFFAMLSKTFNLPIVPVVIDGSFEALESGKVLPRPRKVKVTYLKPIYPEDLTYVELTAKVKKAIEEEIEENPLYPKI